MHDTLPAPVSPNQPTPSAQHRRQMLWQGWVPLGVCTILVLALAILAILGAVQGSDQVERWGNISAVIVILPTLLMGLFLLLLVGGLAFGVTVLLKHMPGWMLSVQMFSIRIALLVRKASDAIVQPVIGVNTSKTRASTLWKTIFQRGSTSK
jgi:hypothetical protein